MIIIYRVVDKKTRDTLYVGVDPHAEAVYEYPRCITPWYETRKRELQRWTSATYRVIAHTPTDRDYDLVIDTVEGWGDLPDYLIRHECVRHYFETPAAPPAGYTLGRHDVKYSPKEYDSRVREFCDSLPTIAAVERSLYPQ